MSAQTPHTEIANHDDNLFVARTILEQLGGKHFLQMTGSHGLIACAGGTDDQPNPWLRMELGEGVLEDRQRLLITLMPNDLYQMEFYTSRVFGDGGHEEKQNLYFRDHVYAEDMQAVFTAATGFLTSLF